MQKALKARKQVLREDILLHVILLISCLPRRIRQLVEKTGVSWFGIFFRIFYLFLL